MEFIENTGAVLEESSVDAATVTNNEPTIEDFAESISSTDDFLETPAAKMAPKQPEIHQGTVTGIGVETSKNTGTKGIVVHLQSKDTGAADRFTIWAPQEFFDGNNWSGGKFALDNLATVPNPGKKQSPRQRYAATINSETAKIGNDGSYNNYADVQLLRQIAKEQGHTASVITPPTNGEDYVALLNALVSGVSVVYTRRPETSEQYGDQLKVNRILSPNVLNLANFDKKFPALTPDGNGGYKGFRRAWDV